jgi:hypothetical protein
MRVPLKDFTPLSEFQNELTVIDSDNVNVNLSHVMLLGRSIAEIASPAGAGQHRLLFELVSDILVRRVSPGAKKLLICPSKCPPTGGIAIVVALAEDEHAAN